MKSSAFTSSVGRVVHGLHLVVVGVPFCLSDCRAKGRAKGGLATIRLVVTEFVPTTTFGFEATEHAGS